VLAAALLAVGMLAGPAAAHTIKVDHPQTGEQIETHRSAQFDFYKGLFGGGWVGGGPLPENAQGQGLMQGPGFMQPASHGKGLNAACYSLEENSSVVDIRGPGPNCPHGQ
jgi:hypothetical protein